LGQERQYLAGYNAVRDILLNAGKRAGITKKTNPHAIRHSSATFYARFLSEYELKTYFGWKMASRMAQIYVHLTTKDVEHSIMKAHGMEINGEDKDNCQFKQRLCSRCGLNNAPTSTFCGRCGTVLDECKMQELIQKDIQIRDADEKLDELLKDPEFRSMFIKKIGMLKQK
jgi:hypothetical protein